MTGGAALAEQFEVHRGRLTAVARRILGSTSEAEDAVQTAWLRVQTADPHGVENPIGWFTTVVARTSLNALRARGRRRETLSELSDDRDLRAATPSPEEDTEQADTVGLAMLVVLDTLSPSERVAFVLQDLFEVPFAEVADVLATTSAAARQHASRARRKVGGRDLDREASSIDRAHRLTVARYLEAIRAGDLETLVQLLDPSVVLTADGSAVPGGRPVRLTGAPAVSRMALASVVRSHTSVLLMVRHKPGIAMARAGRLAVALEFELNTAGDQIIGIDVIADAERLNSTPLALQ